MIYQSELTGKLTRAQLIDVWYKAIKEEQTDVASRINDLLEEQPDTQIFHLTEPQPFLRTIPSGLAGAIDEASEIQTGTGLAKKTLSVSDLYDKINDLVLDAIKEGDLPWSKTWANTDYRLGCSYATGKPYSYANQLLIKSVFGELKNPFFITLDRIKKEGGKLKESFWLTDIYVIGQLWSFMYKGKREAFYSVATARDFVNANYGGTKEEKAKRVSDAYRRFLTTEIVVNGDFVEGIDFKLLEKKYIAGASNQENTPIEVAEAIVNNFPSPKIPISQKQQDKAFYSPGSDKVTMPLMKDFIDSERYYATLFHELIHGTGHPKRLNRLKLAFFGDDNYAAEELVAEIGASYLSAEAGILHHHVQNTAAYLKNWHKQLGGAIQEDSTFLLTAMKYAERAAEFVLQRNSNGTPQYVDQLIEKKEQEQKRKEKENPDLELIEKEIKQLEKEVKKAKPVQKKQIQNQLDLFDQFIVLETSKGLKNPNAHREQMMWQTYLLRIKHRRKTSNAKTLIGQANGVLKGFIGDKAIFIAKKTIAPVVKQTNSQNTFFQLLNLIELLNDPFAIFEADGGFIVVTEMKDYNAKRYMAAVHIDSKKTAIVKSFDSRINQKNFNAWAFEGRLLYSRKGSNLAKIKGLSAPKKVSVPDNPTVREAKLYAKENFAGKKYYNKDIGDNIIVSSTGISKAIGYRKSPLIRRQLLYVIDRIIQSGRLVKTESSRKEKGRLSYTLDGKITLNDKVVNYTVRLNESSEGIFHYDHQQLNIKHKKNTSQAPLSNPVYRDVQNKDSKKGLNGPVEDIVEVVKKVFPKKQAAVNEPVKEVNTINSFDISPAADVAIKTPEFPGREAQQNADYQEVKKINKSSLENFIEKVTENEEEEKGNDTFSLKGELGKFLQLLQRFRLAIVLIGESGAGKSEIFWQLIAGFLELGDQIAVFDLEHGGLRSKETMAALSRNMPHHEQLINNGQLFVFGDAPDGLQTIREAAATGHFNLIAIDSWQELDVLSVEFNNLRKDYPEIGFISIFQMVDGKNIRGGNKPVFDAPIRIKCFKGEDEFDFSSNYAQVLKNRGNSIGGKYSMYHKEMINESNVAPIGTEVSLNETKVAQNVTEPTESVRIESWSGQPISLN